MKEINEKIEAAKAELQQIGKKVKENTKLADDRRKHIAELEANLRMLNLEVTEYQSIEYPQEADVEVMVNFNFVHKNHEIILKILTYILSSKMKLPNNQKS